MRNLIVLLVCVMSACTRTPPPKPADALVAGTPVEKVMSGDGKKVSLAIWSNYVPESALREFEAKSGYKVEVSHYSSNEELLAKLQAGAAVYDLVVPSDYMVFAMGKLGLARELDKTRLPNARSLDPKLLGRSFDPGNRISLPYDWGTTGIAVNRDLYAGEIKGWKHVFGNPKLAGKYTLLDDTRETLGAVLKSLGYSLNTKDEAALAKGKALLGKLVGEVKAFNSETKGPLLNGEIAVAHAYSSDALQARQESGGKIQYVLPEEGATLWIDNLVIPASAPNPDGAHALLNYFLDAKVGQGTVQTIFVAPANREVFPLLSMALKTDAALFPSAADLAKLETMEDLGDSIERWERIWTETKAGSGE